MKTDFKKNIFKAWKKYTSDKKEFYGLKQESEDEKEFASRNLMDPIYYCWNCKYSDCDIHNK